MKVEAAERVGRSTVRTASQSLHGELLHPEPVEGRTTKRVALKVVRDLHGSTELTMKVEVAERGLIGHWTAQCSSPLHGELSRTMKRSHGAGATSWVDPANAMQSPALIMKAERAEHVADPSADRMARCVVSGGAACAGVEP